LTKPGGITAAFIVFITKLHDELALCR